MELSDAMWRAWPAARETRAAGGWLLRETPGVQRRRSNCAVAATGADPDAVPADLVHVRRDDPLDAALAARGWSAESDTRVLTARPVAPLRAGPGVDSVARDAWTARWGALSGRADAPATEREVLARLGDRARYLVVGDAAAALVVVDGPWAGIYCMVVAEHRRRQGLARALLAAAGAIAAQDGAALYLQVEADNLPARRLYANAGFADIPALAYRYRRRPTASRSRRPG
jgi:ribosomal protein S18 acetylase RimI-like enzyme